MFDLILKVQKLPLKIMGLGIRRKVFHIQESDAFVTIVNSSRNTFFYLFFFGLLSVFVFSGFLMLYQGINMTTGLLVVGFVIHPIFGVIGIRKFLWLLRGKEILRIKNEKLSIEKTGTFWTKTKEYQVKDIKNVRTKYETKLFLSQPEGFAENYLAIKELQRIFLSFTIGEVEFDYRGDVIRVFSDLTDDERELVKAKIQSYVQHGEKV